MSKINPINYNIRLEPDLQRFRFDASVDISFESADRIEEIALNILELAIWSCKVRLGDEFKDCPYLVDPAKEALRVFLPGARSDEIILRIEYQGQINDKMAGFYRSGYISGEETRHIAVTQFEESDAPPRLSLPGSSG